MGQETSALNNKRIAKNTILLYIRMLLIMAVGLYTSRVTLNVLGIVDYGLNNVVGGVVTMFAFLNTAMITASQRYITYGLAQNNLDRLKVIFNTSFQVHVIIAIIIVLLGETIGLWFVYNKMVIPPERMTACLWVYHLSIVTMVSTILSVPYNSEIIAHERMGAFAIISIVEAVFKLGLVYLLIISTFDKLILLALLYAIFQIIIQFSYVYYCRINFEESKIIRVLDKPLIKEMGLFASWNLIGNIAVTLCGQGLNLLINMFFGPAINAARAVAVQVDAAVEKFSSNFLMAVNPQLTKLYAQEHRADLLSLLYRSSKFAYFLILSLSLPIFLETEAILTLWLKTVPDYTVPFVRILLAMAIVNTLARPSVTVISATGQVKAYQLVIGGTLLTVVPISYLVLKLGGDPNSVYIVHFVVNMVAFMVRIGFMKKLIDLPIEEYVYNVIWKCSLVTLVAMFVSYIFSEAITNNIWTMLLSCTFSFVITLIFSYFLGMTLHERMVIKSKAISVLRRIK